MIIYFMTLETSRAWYDVVVAMIFMIDCLMIEK